MKKRKVIIIGSGPAAHTAAIYTARALLEPLMFEGFLAAGMPAGGQLTTTTDVENFPGFPNAISGPELMNRMRQQSINCGAEILTKTVNYVDLSEPKSFKVFTDEESYQAESLIIATGATAKRLNLKGEETYWQKGVSACAVCDGALPIFRSNPLAVIGGGDSACEEALFLTKFASKVFLLVRREKMRASKIMQKRVFNNKKIEILWNTICKEFKGDQSILKSIIIENTQTKKQEELSVNGFFYAIGHVANTSFLKGQLNLDQVGYIITEKGTSKTNIEGIFACGDVQDKIYRQAVTAAGSGCIAALEAEEFLNS